jgi:hypothetical protein
MNAAAANATQAANPQLAASEIAREMGQAGFVQPQIAANMNPATATALDKLQQGASGLQSEAGRKAFAQQMGGSKALMQTGLAAAAPLLLGGSDENPAAPAGDSKMPQRLKYNPGAATTTPMPDVPGYDDLGRDFGRQRSYFPDAGYQNISDEEAKRLRGYAYGGPVQEMSDRDEAQTLMANNGQMFAGGGQINLQGTIDMGGGSGGGQLGQGAAPSVMPNPNPYGGDQSTFNGFDAPAIQANPQGFAQHMLQMGRREQQMPGSTMMSGMGRYMNGGQVASFAQGGPSHLGDYSDGGRMLRGPGDGVSDSIPATIGGKRPARLADGEFVVPARIVSEIGNGSSEAGARKLYAMMDRVQKARKKSIGKSRVAVNSRADRLLPA